MIKKVLHTSDWHIGRKLKEHDRYEEFKKFFDWLEKLINTENIDTLLVAGDIFDNTNPSVQAQNLYYSFLRKIAKSPSCRHVVITSGNHDSPAFIDAPSELLKLCKIHVIGQVCENSADEVIELRDENGNLELVVCAVPFLHDKDVRTVTADDDFHAIDKALSDGIKAHYEKVFTKAQEYSQDLPVIAMGHLFVQGGNYNKDEGLRSLYVGTAVKISTEIFPEFLTYTALGHLHSPQFVGRENIRYSGSPIPMTFGETERKKSVCILELDGKNLANIKQVPVPIFQILKRVSGNLDEIYAEIKKLAEENISTWLEVSYTGENIIADLQKNLNDYAKNFPLIEILSIQDLSTKREIDKFDEIHVKSGLDDFSPEKIFDEILAHKDFSQDDKNEFMTMYKEILHEIDTEIGK